MRGHSFIHHISISGADKIRMKRIYSSHILLAMVSPLPYCTDAFLSPTCKYKRYATHLHQATRFPIIFPGQSLAHNFHEAVLGILINSDGQNILSKQRTDTDTSSSSVTQAHERTVQKVERCERIPAWPTRNGLLQRRIAKSGNPDLAARLEHKYGGADCPNLWLSNSDQRHCSPFLMMCHHNHSFDRNDPIRLIEKNIIPEGFPR